MAELATDRRVWWPWGVASAIVAGTGAAIGWAAWRRSEGPTPEGDKDPPPGAELPGLPPAGIKSGAYPGPPSPPHLGGYTQLATTGPGYVVKRPRNAWGTPDTIASIGGALERWNQLAPEFGGDVYEVAIWDVSKQGGGPLAPHKSHDQGRDVDVNFTIGKGESADKKLPTLPLIPLLISFLNDPNLKAIFLDWARQRDVWEALELNPDLPYAAALKAELQYPLAAHTGKTRIRHWDGHGRHIHVRYRQ